MKKIITAVFLLIVIGLAFSYKPGLIHASAGNIYISPSNSSVQINNNVTIALRINPGVSVNAVQATIGYNPSQLQFVSDTLSAFSTCTQNSGGGGTVTISCASLGTSTSSDSLIANITFTALTGSGSATLSLSNVEAANNGTYTDPTSSNGSISFTSPPSAPSPPPSSNSPTSNSPKNSTSPILSKNNNNNSSQTTTTTLAPNSTSNSTPVQIDNNKKIKLTTKVKTIKYDAALINIASDQPSIAYISYGTSQTNLDNSTQTVDTSKVNTVSINSNLTPGTTYYYRVITKDPSGNLVQSAVQSFSTKGFTINLTLLDSTNKIIANKTVILHSEPITVKTNSKGVATFTNVSPGLHHIEFVSAGKTFSQTVYVVNNLVTSNNIQSAPIQTDAAVLTDYKQTNSLNTWAFVLIGAIIVLVIVIIIRISPIRINFKNQTK